MTAEDVKSETPKYSEEIGTIKSGASMLTMSSVSDAGYASKERRKRTKSDTAASAGGFGGAEFSYKEENIQGSNFTNQGYMRFVTCQLTLAVNKSSSVSIFIRRSISMGAFPLSLNFYVRKDGFPLLRNFHVPAHANFTRVNNLWNLWKVAQT